MPKLSTDSEKYLSLLKLALTASLYDESAWAIVRSKSPVKAAILKFLERRGLQVVRQNPFNAAAREGGQDWPMFGFSMAGTRRMSNIQEAVTAIVDEAILGDFVECGVWRGGSSIFARAALDVLGGSERTAWLCDSFEGMPDRTSDDMADPALKGTTYLEASLEHVKANFERFGLLSDKVKFVKGWFSDSLPSAPIGKIAILRLDGDYYSSTMDALNALYDKVAPGGYIIVDDYNAFASCKAAITDFCNSRQIDPVLHRIDDIAVYWRRDRD